VAGVVVAWIKLPYTSFGCRCARIMCRSDNMIMDDVAVVAVYSGQSIAHHVDRACDLHASVMEKDACIDSRATNCCWYRYIQSPFVFKPLFSYSIGRVFAVYHRTFESTSWTICSRGLYVCLALLCTLKHAQSTVFKMNNCNSIWCAASRRSLHHGELAVKQRSEKVIMLGYLSVVFFLTT
jgi:hypothetical protein